MRLARMIALSSELSRRGAEKAILAGEVEVNGEVVTSPATVVDPSTDRVFLCGKSLTIAKERTYLAFHKPRGFIVTKSDPEGRPTIWDALPEWRGKLNSVGRLDFDSEGLLILTDDGDFVNRLTHPRHEIWKTYRVHVKNLPDDASLLRLREGVLLSDGVTLPARVRRVDSAGAVVEISIREGRNRQVRRMFEEIGFPVQRLKRTAVGPVKLGALAVGAWRLLEPGEIAGLQEESEGRAGRLDIAPANG